MVDSKKILGMFKASGNKSVNKPTPSGAGGFDNTRENIDPHIKTKVLDAAEIVLGGTRRTTWPSGGGVTVGADTLWDAKGDLAVGTGSDTAAKLTAGADGLVLKTLSTAGTGLTWAAESGAVDSVFGRTGVVTAAINDYTWAQINKSTSSIADITTKSHTALSDIGTNSHATIDTHIADSSDPHGSPLTQTEATFTTLKIAAVTITVGAAALNDAANKKHSQNTDTALGSGAEAADHGVATTDQIVNVSYGTGPTAPTASTTTEGSLYFQYTA